MSGSLDERIAKLEKKAASEPWVKEVWKKVIVTLLVTTASSAIVAISLLLVSQIEGAKDWFVGSFFPEGSILIVANNAPCPKGFSIAESGLIGVETGDIEDLRPLYASQSGIAAKGSEIVDGYIHMHVNICGKPVEAPK